MSTAIRKEGNWKKWANNGKNKRCTHVIQILVWTKKLGVVRLNTGTFSVADVDLRLYNPTQEQFVETLKLPGSLPTYTTEHS